MLWRHTATSDGGSFSGYCRCSFTSDITSVKSALCAVSATPYAANKAGRSLESSIHTRQNMHSHKVYNHPTLTHAPHTPSRSFPSPPNSHRHQPRLRQILMPRGRNLTTNATPPVLGILHPMRDDRLQLRPEVRAVEGFLLNDHQVGAVARVGAVPLEGVCAERAGGRRAPSAERGRERRNGQEG